MNYSVLRKLLGWNRCVPALFFAAVTIMGGSRTLGADFYTANVYQHRWNTIYQGVNDRFDSYFTFNPAAGLEEFFGQTPEERTIPAEFLALLGNSSLWGNYVGRSGNTITDLDGAVKTQSNGVQCGFDVATFNGFVIGAMFGYEKHRSRFLDDRSDTDDYYFGIYAGKQFINGFDIRGAVGYGSQDFRFAGGENPGGRTLEVNLEIGRRFYKGPNCSLRPFVAFDYLNNKMETEAWNSETKLEQGFLRFGTDAQYINGRLSLTGVLAFSQNVLGNQAANLYGNSVFTFGAGGSYVLNVRGNWTAFANYSANAFTDGIGDTVHTYSIGTQWKF